MILHKAEVGFSVNGKPVRFTIIHNLPDTAGLSFDDALANWMVRTNKHTAKSLCDYINSKHTGHVCMTEKQFQRLQKLGT